MRPLCRPFVPGNVGVPSRDGRCGCFQEPKGNEDQRDKRGKQIENGRQTWRPGRPIESDAQPELVLDLTQLRSFSHIVLQECLDVGQRVERFCVDTWTGSTWQTIAEGTTIGYKRILKVHPVETKRVRLRILQMRLPPAMVRFSLFA